MRWNSTSRSKPNKSWIFAPDHRQTVQTVEHADAVWRWLRFGTIIVIGLKNKTALVRNHCVPDNIPPASHIGPRFIVCEGHSMFGGFQPTICHVRLGGLGFGEVIRWRDLGGMMLRDEFEYADVIVLLPSIKVYQTNGNIDDDQGDHNEVNEHQFGVAPVFFGAELDRHD